MTFEMNSMPYSKDYRNLKVCVVCSDGVFEKGGVAVSLRRMIQMLKPIGIQFYIYEVNFHTLSVETLIRDLWTQKENIMSVNAAIYDDVDANNVMVAGKLKRFLQNTGCSLVHLFYVGRASHIASLVCRDLGLPYIASIRGSDVERSRYFPLRVTVLKDVCQYAKAVTCVTHRLAEILSDICPRSYDVFYNSIIQYPDAITHSSVVNDIQLVADLREYYKKGGPILLRALNEFDKGLLKVIFLGNRPQLNVLRDQELIDSLLASGVIEFRGYLEHSQILEILKTSSAFIQASPTEGCPNMLIEALATGCPVIASRVGVAKEVLKHKQTAYLFDPWSVSELVDGIRWLKTYSEEAILCAVEAKNLCHQYFNPLYERQSWLEIYNKAIIAKNKKTDTQDIEYKN